MSFVPPKSYVAYAFLKPGGSLERIEVPWADPSKGQIVVKVLACGVCASDLAAQYGLLGASHPRVPGHEVVGEVVAVGPGETTWKTGDRVGAGWHGGHCHDCKHCRSGTFVFCEKQDINGILRDGAYAEYCTLRTEACISIPRDADPAEMAPILCAGVTCYAPMRDMKIQPGDIAAVHGVGGLGHLAIQFANKMGFRTVALSSSDSKRDLSLKLGAKEYLDGSKVDQAAELTKLGGADVIFATAPNASAINNLVGGLAPGGTILVSAIAQEPLSVPTTSIIPKRAKIQGSYVGTPSECEETVRFVQAQGVKVMVETFPLNEAQKAYDHREKARFRAVIVPHGA